MRQTLAIKAAPMDKDTPAAANEPQAPRPSMPSAAELYEMIAEAAYFRAQKRGFTPGCRGRRLAACGGRSHGSAVAQGIHRQSNR
jgi:hypothetical protein